MIEPQVTLSKHKLVFADGTIGDGLTSVTLVPGIIIVLTSVVVVRDFSYLMTRSFNTNRTIDTLLNYQECIKAVAVLPELLSATTIAPVFQRKAPDENR